MRSAIPAPIKTYLKIIPSCVIGYYMILVGPTMISMINMNVSERNPKNFHKSNSFEQAIRKRDEIRRYYIYDLIFWQPYKKYISSPIIKN